TAQLVGRPYYAAAGVGAIGGESQKAARMAARRTRWAVGDLRQHELAQPAIEHVLLQIIRCRPGVSVRSRRAVPPNWRAIQRIGGQCKTLHDVGVRADETQPTHVVAIDEVGYSLFARRKRKVRSRYQQQSCRPEIQISGLEVRIVIG